MMSQVCHKRCERQSDCNDPELTEHWIAEAMYEDPIRRQEEVRIPLAEGFEIRYILMHDNLRTTTTSQLWPQIQGLEGVRCTKD